MRELLGFACATMLMAACTTWNPFYGSGGGDDLAGGGGGHDLAGGGGGDHDLSVGGGGDHDLSVGGGGDHDLSVGGGDPDLSVGSIPDLSMPSNHDLTVAPDLASGGNTCAATCNPLFRCCGDQCVNTDNDPKHCGDCSTVCTSAKPYCSGGHCMVAPCYFPSLCGVAGTCCGLLCCQTGQICCDVPGVGGSGPDCVTPTPSQPTCPRG
jgi:Stigma-specific protein, Stig1